MIERVRKWRSGLVALVGLAAAVAIVGCQPQTPLDVYGSTPTFNLTDQSGASFSSQSLAGHVTLLDFIYTYCTDACPIMSATFQEAQRKLADDKLLGSKVMLVSLSVDPTHDTPPVLADYAQQFKADPNSWKMLTGDWDDVWDVVTGFKVATRPPRPAADAPPPGGTEITHTTAVVLIDPQLQVRAYLDGVNMSADDLISAAKRLVR
ncbi:MAG: SCO family protein [Chloroflexi bacterium]|nr:SCO family protein [Chloroflexota bacterium]MBV9599727.1 SCO family protein [Chloroflexota bacterium]